MLFSCARHYVLPDPVTCLHNLLRVANSCLSLTNGWLAPCQAHVYYAWLSLMIEWAAVEDPNHFEHYYQNCRHCCQHRLCGIDMQLEQWHTYTSCTLDLLWHSHLQEFIGYLVGRER